MLGLSAEVRVDLASRPADTRTSFDRPADCASGGLAVRSQAEFRRRHRQFALHSFRTHLDQPLRFKPVPGADRPSAADHHFLPVTVVADPIPSIIASRPHLEIIRSQRPRIAVVPGFDPRTLRRLIAVLEESPCSD
jgi:hypothetical protein